MFTISLRPIPALIATAALAATVGVRAADAPAADSAQALVQTLSNDVVEAVKADKDIQGGDTRKIAALVDQKVMPSVDFAKMTAIAVGRPWRAATPEQKTKVQEQFKALLLRTYSGALTNVKPSTTVGLKPSRVAGTDDDTVVRTEVRGSGDPVQLDYRLAKGANGWKVYDVNVAGVWLADSSFKSQFAPVVSQSGVDGLVTNLTELNQKAGAK